MEEYKYDITIKGNGTSKEIIESLQSIIGGIEEAQEGEHPESAILDGAEWEDNTLTTEINEA
jgi:hypothetical protein